MQEQYKSKHKIGPITSKEKTAETCISCSSEKDGDKNPRGSKHPGYDDPLLLTLTPHQIFNSILFNCGSFTTSCHSLIMDFNVIRQVKAESGENYCWLLEYEWYPHDTDISDLQIDIVLELKIGNAYIYGDFETFDLHTPRVVIDNVWRRAEDAFIVAAALLGLRVKRELVVD
jgi:hypothetical protein